MYFKMLSGSVGGALGAFDSDPLLSAFLLPCYPGPHACLPSGSWPLAPAASDLARLRAWALLDHQAAEVGGQEACPGQSRASLAL